MHSALGLGRTVRALRGHWSTQDPAVSAQSGPMQKLSAGRSTKAYPSGLLCTPYWQTSVHRPQEAHAADRSTLYLPRALR